MEIILLSKLISLYFISIILFFLSHNFIKLKLSLNKFKFNISEMTKFIIIVKVFILLISFVDISILLFSSFKLGRNIKFGFFKF